MSNLVLALSYYFFAIIIAGLTALMIKGIVAWLSRGKGHEAAAAPTPVVAPAAPPPKPAESDIPAIAAAVYSMLGLHRIVHIEEAPRGWAREGRMLQQAKRNVLHNRPKG